MKKTKKTSERNKCKIEKGRRKNADIVFFILFSLFMRKKQKSQNEV